MEAAMISLITVNHDSSALLKECLSSVVSTVGKEAIQLIVVDSGSREEEVESLMTLKRSGVELVLNKENVGYARAVNQGLRLAKGDIILISNPDVVYRPGCIRAMMDALCRLPRCGAVGPRTWWNGGMTFLLPNEFITPFRIVKADILRSSRFMGNVILKGWLRNVIGCWLAEKPFTQEMLSGASIMTTKKVLDEVGAFDESFPLYFEDADWSLRVRRAGYRLYMEPNASIVHYYNQSAKQNTGASQRKFDASLDLYVKKNFRYAFFAFREIRRLLKHAKNRVWSTYEDIGSIAVPPVFTFGDSSRKLLLLSPADSMIPSAGSFFEGASFTVPEDLWNFMGEGRYFLRALDANSLEDRGSWRWIKRRRKT
jgi:GT2 family glycosyltransferase